MKLLFSLITILVSQLFASPEALATPMVEGFDLISATRVDRTKFDYRYSLRVQGDVNSYSNSSFTVASNALSTVVIKGLVTLGSVDPGSFFRSTDTFVLRQDRTVPFDSSNITFKFSGTPPIPPQSAAPRIGAAIFMRQGGRPGHEGYFSIQSDSPSAGANLILKVGVDGAATSVQYSFIGQDGRALTTGAMLPTAAPLPWYTASVQIPVQSFNLSIVALGPTGVISTWTSARQFSPTGYTVELKPQTGLFQKGQSIPVSIVINSALTTGSYSVSVLLPTGFAGNTGPWTVFLSPGSSTVLSANIIAPSSGEPFQRYTLGVLAFPVGSPVNSSISNLNVMVD